MSQKTRDQSPPAAAAKSQDATSSPPPSPAQASAISALEDYSTEIGSTQDIKSLARIYAPVFVSTIITNICGGRPESDDKEVKKAYDEVCLSVLDVCARISLEERNRSSSARLTATTGSIQSQGGEVSQDLPSASPASNPNLPLEDAVDRFLAITPRCTYRFGGPRVGSFLVGCALSGNPVEEVDEDDEPVPPTDLMNAWHVMSFRTEFANLITYIVDQLGLPRPANKTALEFDDEMWRLMHQKKDPQFFSLCLKFKARVGGAFYSALYSYGCTSQGGPFAAMIRYVHFSIYEYYRSDETITLNDAHQKWKQFRNLLHEIQGATVAEISNVVKKLSRGRNRGCDKKV